MPLKNTKSKTFNYRKYYITNRDKLLEYGRQYYQKQIMEFEPVKGKPKIISLELHFN